MFNTIPTIDLVNIVGGVDAAQWNQVREQAGQYCPVTAAKYAKVDPQTLTRAKAQQMGNSCLAEMNPFTRTFAKGRITQAIDDTFPK